MPAYLGGPPPEPPEEYPFADDAEAIYTHDDRERVTVRVPEWKLNVELLTPPAHWVDKYLEGLANLAASQGQALALTNSRAKLVALCAVKPGTTELLFKSPADVQRLGRKSSTALARLAKAADQLAALSEKDIKDIVKNSAETLDDDGQSDSPESED